MPKTGPRPTPTATLAQRGSHRAKEPRRQNEITIPPLVSVPAPPEWMSKDGAKHFTRLAPVLHAAGLLSPADVDLLAMLAEKHAQYIALRNACAKEDPTIYNEMGVGRKNPSYSLRDEAQRDMLKLYQELGMSPSARVGLVVKTHEQARPENVIDIGGGDFAT